MKLLLKRLNEDWPCWMAVSFFALLPFGRLAEIPLSAFAFSLPFIANRDVDVITAVVSSINAVLRNRRTMLLWGALVAALTAVGFLTGMLGFIVIIPWLGYATWHGYRDALDVSDWKTLPVPRSAGGGGEKV